MDPISDVSVSGDPSDTPADGTNSSAAGQPDGQLEGTGLKQPQEETKEPPLFPGLLQEVSSDMVSQLGDRFLVIKKPLGGNLKFSLEDLYVSKSIRIVINNSENNIMDTSYIGRLNKKDIYIGEPEFTEINTLEVNPDDGTASTVTTKDYGTDVVHGITITNELNQVTGQYTIELMIELDNVYAHILKEDEAYYYIDLKKPKDVYDKILVIDAGHGGKDAGAIAYDELSYEKDINVQIVQSLKELLDKENIKVYYTRTKDD
jgi:N-acetylmuramoyl-L-alanine amidase